ncbi:hypothetical protein CCACVL1_26717 [Corchorus capsularis]|uniref:Uncharacterized protein n=1 Tax=Corchorus capsularis TaxID=210143 RepID=A0A1R3GDN4_COCAP|nr:hypothetical protein CCACVL1_26717 [Corchorus capsularis]
MAHKALDYCFYFITGDMAS